MTSKLEILKMIEAGELTVEEGLELIETLDQTERIEEDIIRESVKDKMSKDIQKVTLDVSLVSSRLNVERSNVEDVTIELYDDKTRELVEQPEWLHFSEEGNRISIKESRVSNITDVFDFFRGIKDGMGTLFINMKLPMNTVVDRGKFTSVSGSISILGIKGVDVEASSVSGKVHAADLEAQTVKLKSTSGRVIGDAIDSEQGVFTSTSGRVKVTGSQRMVKCSSVSGVVEYEGGSRLDEFSGSSVSGKLSIRLPEPELYNLNLTSVSGTIDTSGFAVVDKSGHGKKSVIVKDRSDHRYIKGTTVSGKIVIDKS